MQKLYYEINNRSSEIYIQEGILDHVGSYCASRFRGRKAHIVTDSTVESFYYSRIKKSFTENGFSVSLTVISPGERSKTFTSLDRVYSDLLHGGIRRNDLVVALGGGVVGDIAGFAASTFLRGTGLCQIPTSLLAQVDSSVGGKNGIDLPEGKNLIGSIYQPDVVFVDPLPLKTLTDYFFHDGMAEVVKYGFLFDNDLLNRIDCFANDNDVFVLTGIIQRCIELKMKTVVQDEQDRSTRVVLNFGHTIGHAIEKCTGYETVAHGHAVALGMLYAIQIGQNLGLTKTGVYEKCFDLLSRFSLTKSPDVSSDDLLEAIHFDKKFEEDTLRFVLLKDIEEPVVYNLSEKSLSEIISSLIN